MKLRSEIDDKYKWNLEFGTDDDISKAFSSLEYLTNNVKKYYGKFGDKEMFFDYFSLTNEERWIDFNRLAYFVGNNINVDQSNTEILKLSDRIENAYRKYLKESSFVSAQLKDLDDEYLRSLLLDSRAKDLDNIINDLIADKPHLLDEKSEVLLAKLSNSFNNSQSVFNILNNSDMTFDDALDSKRKKHKVTNAEYSKLIISHDRTLRKNAYNSLLNGYKQFNKTIAELYISHAKAEKDSVELHNYSSLLDSCLYDEKIPKVVFDNNIKVINKSIPLLQDYIKTINKQSGLSDYAYYDLFENIENKKKFNLNNSKKILLDAVSPLGKEYVKMVKYKLNDKSIDYMPNMYKQSGAYCSNEYGCKTVILMNWTDNFDSLSTLTHEMGHCINAEYFNKYQPSHKAGITIFAAEMASTVNEILLLEYMIKNEENKEFYLKELLNMMRTTIFRQTLFSEFEDYVHSSIQKEIPLTYEELNNKYFDLNKKYYGDSCILPENLAYEWSRIPHFYNAYYVYSYSTGLITAVNIVRKIQENPEYSKSYIEFLKNGTNKPAVEILKEIDIDLTTEQPFDIAFDYFKGKLNEYKNILQKSSR